MTSLFSKKKSGLHVYVIVCLCMLVTKEATFVYKGCFRFYLFFLLDSIAQFLGEGLWFATEEEIFFCTCIFESVTFCVREWFYNSAPLFGL